MKTAVTAALAVVVAVAALRGGAAAVTPPALYTTVQAADGAKQWAASCAQCHGAHLEGGVGPALTGPNLKTLATKTKLTVGDMYDYMSQNMPMNAPASLTKKQYSAILSYILKVNGYPAGSAALTPAVADGAGAKVIIAPYK